jgi:hypothetical protein
MAPSGSAVPTTGRATRGGRFRLGDVTSFADSSRQIALTIGGGHLVDTRDPFIHLGLSPVLPKSRDTEEFRLGLSTRLHCLHIIVPLPRDPPYREPSRERGEQAVRPHQVYVERHLEPSPIRLREQPVRVVRAPHVRSAVGLPSVRWPQTYEGPRDEREPHDSGLFHLDQVADPPDYLACPQTDSTQCGVIVPKFRTPGVDFRNGGSKPFC